MESLESWKASKNRQLKNSEKFHFHEGRLAFFSMNTAGIIFIRVDVMEKFRNWSRESGQSPETYRDFITIVGDSTGSAFSSVTRSFPRLILLKPFIVHFERPLLVARKMVKNKQRRSSTE